MKVVQPIKDDEVIDGIKEYLKIRSIRNYLFFCMGIYSGLRVSDLLSLQVKAVRGQTHIMIRESKTAMRTVNGIKKKMFKPEKKFIIHPAYKEDLDKYIVGMDDEAFLFPSRQQKTKSKMKGRPIHRTTAYKMLNGIAEIFKLTEIGCHTMRKTWGYRLYVQDPENLAFLMEMFNHSKQTVTLRYLGLTQDAMDRAILKLR